MKRIELALSVSAMAVSVAAAAFSWWQVDISKTHNKISVSPLLTIETHIQGPGRKNGLYISNVGLWPAIITGISALSNDHTATGFSEDHWPAVLQAAGLDEICFGTNWPNERQPIRAGDEIGLLTMTTAPGAESCLLQVMHLMSDKGLELEIKYESIYQVPAVVKDKTSRDAASMRRLFQMINEELEKLKKKREEEIRRGSPGGAQSQ